MGATLQDTLNEAAALAQAQQQPPPPPTATVAPPKPKNAQPLTPPVQPTLGQKIGGALSIAAKATGDFAASFAQDPAVRSKTRDTVGAAILRAPGQLVGGTIDTLADAGKFVDDNIQPGFARAAVKAVALPFAPQALAGAQATRTMNHGASLADTLSLRKQLGSVGYEKANQFLTEAGAALVGAVGGEGEVVAGTQLVKTLGPKLAPRVAKLLLSSAKQGAAAGVSVNAADLPERARNAAIGGAANLILEPLITAIPALINQAGKKVVASGTAEDAAKDALDRTFATQRTDAARTELAKANLEAPETSATVEPTPQEVVPAGGARHDDLPTEHPLAHDANALLEKAGAAERLDVGAPPPLAADGRIRVAQATKDTLDKQGAGRAFIGADEPLPKDPVIFKETAEDGSQRVVGIMDKYDLQKFTNDAQYYAENPHLVDAPADSHVGQWKLGNLGASYDVGARGRALTEALPGLSRPKSDEELYQMANRIANETGLQDADVLRLGQEWAGTTRDLDEGMLAVRMVQGRVLNDLGPHAEVNWSQLDPADPSIQDALDAVHNALTFHTYIEEGKTGLGRGLRAAGLPPTAIPDHATYRANFGKTPDEGLAPRDPRLGPGLPRTPKELSDWFDLYKIAKAMDDPDVLNSFLSGQTFKLDKWLYLRNSFPNFFTAAIVSAPRTFVRDLWGPAVVSTVNTLGRATAGGMAAVNPLLSSAARAEAWSTSWGAVRAYTMAMGDIADSLKFAGMTIKRGFSKGASSADSALDPFGSTLPNTGGLLGGHNPVDFNTQGVPRALIHAATQSSSFTMDQVPYLLGNLVNKFPQAIHVLHGGVNELAQRLSYLGEVRAGLYNQATKDGLKGADFDRFIKDGLKNATDETGKYTDQAAFDASERTAFIKRPNPNDPQILQKAMSTRAALVKAVPELRYIVPIFTVPANAMGETLRRIPGLNLLLNESRGELLGHAGVPAQVDAYGRMMTGGAALMGGWLMASSGNLTGAGPHDPTDRAAWLTTHQPYSIRVGGSDGDGGHWVSYAKSDLLGPLLGIMAGSYDHSVYHSADDNGGIAQGVYAGSAALAEYFKEQAALQTLAQFMSIGDGPGGGGKAVERLLGMTASGFIPNFVNQLGRETTDDLLRIKRNPWDYIKDRLPGASTTLDPVRNFMGEPVHKAHAPGLNSFPANIARANTYEADPVLDELDRLYSTTGYAPGALSPAAGGQAHFDLRDAKLEDGRSLYDAIMRARLTSTIDGATLRETLDSLIQSPEYADALDGTGKSGEDPTSSVLTRGGMIAKTFQDFNKQTKADVAESSPLAARWLATAAAKSGSSAALRPYSAESLVKDPSLFEALGINIQDYEDKVRGQ